MADSGNNPLGGNNNNNQVDINILLGAVQHLATSQEELVNGLKAVQKTIDRIDKSTDYRKNHPNTNINIKNISQLKKAISEAIKFANRRNGTGGNSNQNQNQNQNQNNNEKKKEAEKKFLTEKEIKRLKSLTEALDKSSNEIVKLANKLADGSQAFRNIPNELKQYAEDLKNAVNNDIKNRKREELNFKKELTQKSNEIKIRQSAIRALEIQQKSADATQHAILQQEIDTKKKEIDGYKGAMDILQDNYIHSQEQAEESAKSYETSVANLNKALASRENIEKKNNELSNKSYGDFSQRFEKLKTSLFSKQSEEYKSAIDASKSEDAETIKRLEVLNSEEEMNKDAITEAEQAIQKFDIAIAELEQVISAAGENASNEDKQYLNQLKNNKKAQSEAIIRHKQALENNKQEKTVLKGSLEANKNFRENLTKQTNIFSKLGDKLASTITKAFTSVVEHQLQMLVDSANSAFDAIESTQKTLGKTLKMNSGEYSEFVDMIQEAAKDAGTAISSPQALELATTVAEMGVRDENLIKTLAIEQAKIQEAGLTGIVQLNEETIKQYQQEYLKDIQKVGQDQAEENLKKRLDNVIAIEYAVSEEFKSATALANGGFAEIQNYANEMEKAGYVTAENRAEFEYTLARFAQNIENQGGNFSEVLTQFSSLLTNTESDLGAQMLTFLSGNTDKTGNDMVEATTEMLNRYLQQTQSIYGGLNATSLKYVKQAYNDDRTATNIKTLTETGTLEAKTLEDLEISTNKLNSAISDGDYLSATERMQKKQLDYVEEIAQKMQKIPDGKYYMDAGLNTAKDLLTGLSGFLGSFLGNMFGSSLGGFGTNMSGSMNNTTSTGGLGAFLTGNKATKAGVIGSEIAGAAGILYGEAILAKNAYKGYQEDGLKGGLVGLAEGTGDKEFARGMGMALGGALGGPVGAAIGGTLSAELVPKAQRSFEKLITSGIADPAADAYKEMKEAGDNLKESATQLSDSAQQQLKNLEQEKAQLEESSALEKKDWIKEHEEDFKSMGIDTKDLLSDLSSSDAINKAYSQLSEQYYKKAESNATQMLSAADLGSSIANVVGSRSTLKGAESEFLGYTEDRLNEALKSGEISEEQFNYNLQSIRERQGKTFLAGLSSEGATSSFVNYIESIAKDKKISLDEAVKEYGKTINADEDTINYMKAGLDTIYNRRDRYDKINTQFQKMYKEALEKANSDDPVAIEDAFEKLGTRSVKIEDSPFTSIDVSDLQQAIVDKDGTLWRDSPDKMPSLTTNNGTYAGYKIGLDYVPYDNYLALLHRGETVLNANEAQEYRTDNNINFDTITNTLVSQTDRIETILKQIYTAILTISRGSNRTTLNPNIVNMVSGIATL